MTNLLDGLRVLDLSLWQPGHTATQLLADLGAEVIKVEPPGGDRMRPLVDRFVNFNGHKQSVVLDLKRDADREAFLHLVARSEVVVENYRPGVADRLGIGFDALRAHNPSIVMCSISGFGQEGPLAGTPGHEFNYQAVAGAFTRPADAEPVPAGILVGDQGSGLAAAFAILAAVLCARRTGEAEHVDVSMADLLASWVAPLGAVDPRREPRPGGMGGGGRSPGMGTFRTADGRWIVLGIFSEDHFWDALCEALGMDDAVGLSMAERSADAALTARVAAAIGAHECDALVELLTARSVPAAPVLTRAEMLEHPHFRARGLFVDGPDGFLTVTHPVRYQVHPALAPGSPPALDADRDAVLGPVTANGG